MTELPDISLLTHEQKDELIRFIFGEMKKLATRVEELEARLAKNSHNSSKPPSSDGLGKKTASLRKPSGKKPGGQKGHSGKTLKRVASADEFIYLMLPPHCDSCGRTMAQAEAQIVERRQVFDIPAIKHQVKEYCKLEARCACGKLHSSDDFPAEVSEAAQYGPNIQALAVYLTQGQLLPYARTSELIRDMFQLEISPGTLVAWVGQTSERLRPTVDVIAANLRQASVVGADESGLRVTAKLHWLHTVVTPTQTWYGVHAKRGIEAIRAHAILTGYQGTVVHDCWKPYWQLDCIHALCNAHLLRELVFIQESTAQTWPQRMADVLLAAHHECQIARTATTELTAQSRDTIVAHYRAVLKEGQSINPAVVHREGRRGRIKQSSAYNLLDRLHKHEAEVLRFVQDSMVPFTNNLAERAIRMPKVKQKISGSFRSFDGAENFAVIRSYLDNMRKQGHRMFDVLRSVFSGHTIQPA